MLTFILSALIVSVIMLFVTVIALVSDSDRVEKEFNENLEEITERIFTIKKDAREVKEINAKVFNAIAKELGKEFNKVRVLENAGEYNEEIVTKFELVKAPKAKK